MPVVSQPGVRKSSSRYSCFLRALAVTLATQSAARVANLGRLTRWSIVRLAADSSMSKAVR